MSRRRLATVSGQKIILLSIFFCFGIRVLWIFEPVQRWDEGRKFLTHSQKEESELCSFTFTKFDLGHLVSGDRFRLESKWNKSADRFERVDPGSGCKKVDLVSHLWTSVTPLHPLAILDFDFDFSPSHGDRVSGGNNELWTVVDYLEKVKFIYVRPATRGDELISGISKRTGARWDDGACRLSKEVPSAKIGSRPKPIYTPFTVPSSLRQQWIVGFMAHVLETSADLRSSSRTGRQPHSEVTRFPVGKSTHSHSHAISVWSGCVDPIMRHSCSISEILSVTRTHP